MMNLSQNMVSNLRLFSIANFDFRLQHLLVIGILILSFSVSMLVRATPISYGLELFEFDPFFNYRATEYLIENGEDEYFNWIDEKSWHPFGRNVSETSQTSLHLITAYLYQVFGFTTSLYNFTILFPLVIGSLTSIVVFAFVRVIGGTTAGLFAALIFSISVPIFTRGLIGWFKSEPLGLFLGILAMYLFVSGIKFNKGKISFVKLASAGFFLALGLSAWGGILFFVLTIAIFYFVLPLIKNEKNFLLWAGPIFPISLILFSLMFDRTSFFVLGAGIGFAGITILLPTGYVLVCEIIRKFSSQKTRFRNSILFLVSIIATGIGIFVSGIIQLPSFRYQNALNPFLTAQDALTDSVAEHMTTSLNLSFSFLSIFMVFTVIGIWVLFSKKYFNQKLDMRVFALVVGIIAIYVSSAFVRLELFASVSVIILGSIGLSIIAKKIFEQEKRIITKIIFPVVIIILFIVPPIFPEGNSWTEWADFSPSILNGGSTFSHYASNDWPQAMEWLKSNTSPDAVIASWWDYGYWITAIGERTTIVDNATLIDWQIKKMGYALITTPDNSYHILNSHYSEDISEYLGDETILALRGDLPEEFDQKYLERYGKECEQIFKAEAYRLGIEEQSCNPVSKGMNADYLLIYIAGERFYVNDTDIPLYTLEGGGDESKKTWFAKISGHQVSKFIEADNITPTKYFMENSTLGKLIPFSIIKYAEPNTGRTFDKFSNGLIPIYVNDFKLSDPDNDPYILVYASPTFTSQQPGIVSAVLIYKINPDYSG